MLSIFKHAVEKISAIAGDFLMPDQLFPALPAPDRPALDKGDVLALFPYRDRDVRKVIWAIKYRGNRSAITMCAEALHDALVDELADRHMWQSFENPVLIPIPMSKKRLRERGFNQTILLAKAVVKRDNGRLFAIDHRILHKTRETKSQTSIKDKKERLRNLADCFEVKDTAKIAGRNIILLDDVTTTGSTFREAKKALITGGAKRVFCIALAH